RINFGNFAPRRFDRSLLLRTVQSEERSSLGDRTAIANINLSDASYRFRNNWDGSEVKRDVGGGRMIVEDDRNQAHGQNDAGCNAPPQLKPHRVECDLPSQPLSLNIAAKEIIGQNGQH